jgi:hypothetical protein
MSEILRRTPTALYDLSVQILANQKKEDRDDAATLLQFLLFAPDNNDLNSLHHALAFAFESPPVSLNQWERSQDYSSLEMFKKRIRNLSCGLVEVVDHVARPQSRVQFIHETTRAFFSENNYMRLREMLASNTDSIVGRSHLKIMKSFLNYMGTEEAISISLQTTCDYIFTPSEIPTPRVYINPIKISRQALKRQADAWLPFLNYAVHNLDKHRQAADSCLPWEGQSVLIRRFEDNHRELFKTWKILRLSFREPGEVKRQDTAMAIHTSLPEFAAHQGMKHCLPRLLRREEDPANILLKAISKGQYDVAESLINEGTSINAACDAFGKSALFYADDIRMTRLLVGKGADVNALSRDGSIVLHHVICDLLDPGCRQAIIKCLLDHGADVNGTRAHYTGLAALHVASADVVPILLEHKPNTNISDNYDRTALQKARQDMDWEKVRLLKEYGAR